MDITLNEDALFAKWSNGRSDFVTDGVVSEVDYHNSALKICFVLKEVNDLGGGGWDLRQFIREGARYQTWNNVTRWVRCIKEIDVDHTWADVESVTDEDRVNVLSSICVMNLKKSPGSHTTERIGFDKAVEEDKEYIKEQYHLYYPDITICGGTGWHLRHALCLNENEIFVTKRGVQWFVNHLNKPVIIYSHPEARVSPNLLLYGLIDAIKEILDVK